MSTLFLLKIIKQNELKKTRCGVIPRVQKRTIFLNNLKSCSGSDRIYYPEKVQLAKSNRFDKNGYSLGSGQYPKKPGSRSLAFENCINVTPLLSLKKPFLNAH